jgi:hypothetical protein
LWWLHALGKVGQFQTQRENYLLIVPPPWSNKFKLKQEIKTKMDTPGKFHSELPYHRSHTFVRLGKLPAGIVIFFALLRMEDLLSIVRRSVCATFLGRMALAVLPRRLLFLNHDFRLRGRFLATPFGLLSFVTVQKAAANQQKQTK